MRTLLVMASAMVVLATDGHRVMSQLPKLPDLPFGKKTRSPFDNPRNGNPLNDLIRSQAGPQVQNQWAQQEAIRTKEMKVESYWYKKRLGQAEIAKDHAKKRATRDNYLEKRGSGAPDRLGRDELDSDSGVINWPTGLLAPTYASDRRKIEKLFRERAAVGNRVGLSSEIKSACLDMERKLRSNITSMTTTEYLNCRKFLESLRDENRNVSR